MNNIKIFKKKKLLFLIKNFNKFFYLGIFLLLYFI